MKSQRSKVAEDCIKEAAEWEYRRLLYVGMTRAEDRLIVCGYHGRLAQNTGTWHALVTSALAGATDIEQLPAPLLGEGFVRSRYRTTPSTAIVPEQADDSGPAAPAPRPAPTWLADPVPPEPVLPRPLTPSRAVASIEPSPELMGVAKSPVLKNDDEPSFAIARGLAIHRLLQILPGLPEAEREAAAQRYLERIGKRWSAAERSLAAGPVMAILADAAFAPIFSQNSRAEVGIAGTLAIGGAERSISGKIDRLAVTDDAVLVVDYKTNRPPPSRLDEVPEAYVAQLALYRALLRPLYPGRAVRAALLFTEAPRLIALPEPLLEDTLARLTRA